MYFAKEKTNLTKACAGIYCMMRKSTVKTQNCFQATLGKGLCTDDMSLLSYTCLLSFLVICTVLFSVCLSGSAYADGDPLDRMKDDILTYFIPLTGTITAVENKKVDIDLGTEDSIKPGMRFQIIREVAPFKHPVTKETLGNLESSVGTLEIKEVQADSSIADVIEGDAKIGDTVRISAMHLNMLFCQSSSIDWYLADSYYRKLKDSGRFAMIDTSLETDVPSQVIEEAARLKADIAILLTAQTTETGTLLTQKLYWVTDGTLLHETEIPIKTSYSKELKFGEEFLTGYKDIAILKFDLPYSSRFVTTGDIDGDGKHEIIICTNSKIRIYTLGVDLQPALGGITIEGSSLEEYLWIESLDLNGNGRDEVIVTVMRNKAIKSYIYELHGTEFIIQHEDDVFMRKIGNRLIAQDYSSMLGFDGPVFHIVWEGEYKHGDKLDLPEEINIYDFVYADDPLEGKVILAYDGHGFLNLYGSQGLKLWRSESNTGGFLTTFRKSYSPARNTQAKTDMEAFVDSSEEMIDRGTWAMKDRLFVINNEFLFIQRTPLLKSMKFIGFKNSQIKNLWWNGLSMEEGNYIDEVSGTILDYTVAGSKILVLTSPKFGIKTGNILKGENPFQTTLYIYSMKKA